MFGDLKKWVFNHKLEVIIEIIIRLLAIKEKYRKNNLMT